MRLVDMAWNTATKAFLATFTPQETAEVALWVSDFNENIEDEAGCCNPPNLVLDRGDAADRMKSDKHECCGWYTSHAIIRGQTLVCGICAGH